MKEFPSYKTVSVSSLIPYARNSRTHSDAQVGKIAASIKEFGFLNPVIVDSESGIIAGHGRVLAAQKLGLAELPVIEVYMPVYMLGKWHRLRRRGMKCSKSDMARWAAMDKDQLPAIVAGKACYMRKASKA